MLFVQGCEQGLLLAHREREDLLEDQFGVEGLGKRESMLKGMHRSGRELGGEENAAQAPVFGERFRSWADGKNGTGNGAKDLLGHGAGEKLLQAMAAVATDDDEIDVTVRDEVGDDAAAVSALEQELVPQAGEGMPLLVSGEGLARALPLDVDAGHGRNSCESVIGLKGHGMRDDDLGVKDSSKDLDAGKSSLGCGQEVGCKQDGVVGNSSSDACLGSRHDTPPTGEKSS